MHHWIQCHVFSDFLFHFVLCSLSIKEHILVGCFEKLYMVLPQPWKKYVHVPNILFLYCEYQTIPQSKITAHSQNFARTKENCVCSSGNIFLMFLCICDISLALFSTIYTHTRTSTNTKFQNLTISKFQQKL